MPRSRRVPHVVSSRLPRSVPRRLAALAALVLGVLSGALPGGLTPAQATVIAPESVIRAEDPVVDSRTGEVLYVPLTLHLREDVLIGDLALDGGTPGLRLETEGADGIAGANGYRAVRYRLYGLDRSAAELPVVVTRDGEREERVLSVARPAAPHDLDATTRLVPGRAPRVNPADFDLPAAGDPGLGASSGVLGGAGAAARTVRVHGRIVMALPDSVFHGVDGATIQVVQPVDILSDNVLAEHETDMNGDFDFTFELDEDRDIYLKILTRNRRAVNVGTGLFFDTYSRRYNYDDFSGIEIDFGERTFLGDFNQALYITHALTRVHRWNAGEGQELDRCSVRFPDNSRNVSWYMPTAGLEGIHLRRDNVWEIMTLYHEYGHHWVYQRASANAPLYCNGMCEPDGSCGHCYYCAENSSIAWSEGFPYWLAGVTDRAHTATYGWRLPNEDPINFEYNAGCSRAGGRIDRAMDTESAFAAFLYDLIDGNNENDETYDDTAFDRTTLPLQDIILVATGPKPVSSSDFLRDFAAHLETKPGDTGLLLSQFWSTVRNNGLDEDFVRPTAPTSIASPTHPVGVPSRSNMPTLLFGGATDDESGVRGYYVTLTPNVPAAPDGSGHEVVGSSLTWNTPLAPGAWFANVQAVDGAGNRSTDHLSYGPMVVEPPQPVDLGPVVEGLWEDAVVVRNTPDASASAAGFPAVLDTGDVFVSYRFGNLSPSGGPADTMFTLIHVDGGLKVQDMYTGSVFGAGETWTQVNRGPIHLTPGRHRVSMRIDGWDRIAEPDEENNFYGVSVVTAPKPLAAGPWENQPRPPAGNAGDNLAPGTPPNQAGFRFTPAGAFGAVLMQAESRSFSGTRLRAYQPSTGPLDGFDDESRVADDLESSYGAGVVVAAAGSEAGGAFDFGVIFAESAKPFRIRAHDSEPLTLGTVFERTMGADDYLLLFEVDLGPNDTYFNLTLSAEHEGIPEDQMVEALWVSEADTAKSLHRRHAVVFGDGLLSLSETVPGPGTYCVVIKRRIRFSGELAPVHLTIASSVTPLPQVTIPTEDPKWPAPLLPQPNLTKEDTLRFPEVLLGEVSQTYLNLSLINSGPWPTTSAPIRLYVNDEPALDHDFGVIQPGERVEFRNSDPLFVRGGRRTLALVADPDDTVDELWDGANVFALQYGWVGETLTTEKPLTRAFPPDPIAWASDVAVLTAPDPLGSGEGSFTRPLTYRVPNCDGVRFAPALDGKRAWYGVAAMPAEGDDIDLSLFEGNVPAAEAYVNAVAGSHEGSSVSEFLLVNGMGAAAAGGVFGMAEAPAYDVGVYNAGAHEDYLIHAVDATALSHPQGTTVHGTFHVKRDRVMALHEVYLAPGTYEFEALNKSDDTRIGLSLHAPMSTQGSPYQGGDDAGERTGRSPTPGDDARVSVEVGPGEEGIWCLVARKVDAGDLGDLMGYQLVSHATSAGYSPIAIDGVAEAAYGPVRATQALPTSAGNSTLGALDEADGSELDQVFSRIVDDVLYLTFTGNLRSDLSRLEVFLDVRDGGQNELRGDNVVLPGDPLGRMGDTGAGGLRFDGDFTADYYLSVFCGEVPYRVTALMATLPTAGGGTGGVLGSAGAGGPGILYVPDPPDANPHGVRVTVDNSNTAGVDDASVGNPDQVTTGVEIAVPLAALGDPTGCVRVTAFLNDPVHGGVANQTLPPLPAGTGHLGEPRAVDFSAMIGDQFVLACPAFPLDVEDEPRVDPTAGPVRLLAPSRNPFHTRTEFRFTLEEPRSASLRVFDIRGRLVRTLLEPRRFGAGLHEVGWDGLDDAGARVASGVYHVRLSADDAAQSRRVVFTR